MQFKSKTGHILHGQPQVFFSCHPSGFDAWKEQVEDDVLACCDCAFCWSDPSDNLPDSLEDLAQMGLFVFAIDRRFVEQDCPANTILWNYALEHHIPILPLLMEQGLVLPFNKRFGDIHALLGYGSVRREKLRSYLDRLFVRPELAQEIRQSFDAHLFLSYRKVDAADAAKLIKAIRKFDYCRDIAIWFDAYLSPGENFEEGIRAALQECDLFLLLVTPSLLTDEDNYVRREEYPAARRMGRSILPVEMEHTDRVTLESWYADIPKSVDGLQPVALDLGLQSYLDAEALGRNNEGRHLYCMGLAYLQGVDVEMDKARAAKLIERAAQAKVPDAMRTLQRMCQDGNGVRRDYSKAAQWSAKFAQSLRPEQANHKTAPDCLIYIRQLVDAAKDYGNLRQADRALELLDEGICFLHPYEEGQDPTLDICLALLASTKATMQMHKGKNDLALESFKRALRCFDLAGQTHRENEFLHAWANTLLGEAALVTRFNQLEQGHASVKKALSLYEESYAQNHSYEAGVGCAQCHGELIQLALNKDQQQKAMDHLQAATDMLGEVKERHGEGRTLLELYAWDKLVGDLESVATYYEGALGSYQSAERILDHLCEGAGTILESQYLQNIYAKLGITYLSLERPDDAERYLYPGYLMAMEIEYEIGDIQSKDDLGFFCHKLGRIARERGDLEAAETYILKDVELSREIDRAAQTFDTRYNLGVSLLQLGLLMRDRRQRKKMDRAFSEAYDIFDKLDDDSEGTVKYFDAMQYCLKAWTLSSNELDALKPQKRPRSEGMRRASRVLRVVGSFVGFIGIVTQLLPSVPSMLLPAVATLLVIDCICKFALRSDTYMLSYAVFSALGALIGTLLHVEVLIGAAMGCCLETCLDGASDLIDNIIIAFDTRGE